jgi:hypothetical protein
MAERPVFIPIVEGQRLVRTVQIAFGWAPGMALSQAQKRIRALHVAAKQALGLQRLLEISSKSPDGLGVALSAFNLKLRRGIGSFTTVESAYQSGKRFTNGGPFTDLACASSGAARSDPRLKSSGPLIGFSDASGDWGLQPPTAYYDWLYLTALRQAPHLSSQLLDFEGFTDIAFNPEKSLSCQARSAALFVALQRRNKLDSAIANKEAFVAACDAGVMGTGGVGLFEAH